MQTHIISEDFLDEQEKAVINDLLELYQDPADEKHLKLTGLEIFAFLGSKVVLPIITGFIGRILYDKYSDIRTRKMAQEAREDLLRKELPAGEPIDRMTMESEVIESLIQEGIPQEHAKRVVSNAIERINDKLTKS